MATSDISVTIVQDEPWVFLDARKNPVNGRKITGQLADGTYIDVDITEQEYKSAASVKAKLQEKAKSHYAIMS
jgi:hypothetical protein